MGFQVQSLGFLLCRVGLGPAVRAVRVFLGWQNTCSWRSSGKRLLLVCLEGLAILGVKEIKSVEIMG